MPGHPDFPADEYQQRYARARTLMEEAHLDGLLITDELNYIYFTGHRSQQNPVDKIRPYVYILPRDGDGVLITMPFEVGQVQETTWVEDVRQAGLMGHSDLIASILTGKGLAKGRIGAELGREQYLGISYNEFSQIQNALPKAEFRDAAPVLLKLRAIKSPREVEYLRKSAEISATSEAEMFASIRAGMTELETARILRERLAANGGEKVNFLVLHSGPGMVSVPTERKLRAGDIVVCDTGAEYRGYCSDVARTASVGEPSDEVAEFYSWTMAVRQKCSDLLRAGNTPRIVVSACREAISQRGGLETMGVGRIGHGVGLETTEYPSLAMEEDIVFEPGMVFACNPNFVRPFGFFNAEDNWLVTEGAPNLLSSPIAPNKLPVIPLS
jgi:Xaa-Pro aminopeptidase